MLNMSLKILTLANSCTALKVTGRVTIFLSLCLLGTQGGLPSLFQAATDKYNAFSLGSLPPDILSCLPQLKCKTT